MPNWCLVDIKITFETESEASRFHRLVCEWTAKDYIGNGFGTSWLGNIVGNSGLANWERAKGGFFRKNGDLIYCRGDIISLNNERQTVRITEESAWEPAVKLWLEVLELHKFKNYRLIYNAEEPGNEVLITNDDNLLGTYYIDVYDTIPDDQPDGGKWIDGEYSANEQTVRTLAEKYFEMSADVPLSEVLSTINSSSWVIVSEWEYTDENDLN